MRRTRLRSLFLLSALLIGSLAPLQGQVTTPEQEFGFQIGADGLPQKIETVESSGSGTLDRAAAQAVERAGTKAGNKGADAAVSAIETVNLLKQLES